MGYRWEKEEKTKGTEGPSEESGLPFSRVPTLLTWQTMSGIMCSLILIESCPALYQQVGASHPTPADGAACQRAEL